MTQLRERWRAGAGGEGGEAGQAARNMLRQGE